LRAFLAIFCKTQDIFSAEVTKNLRQKRPAFCKKWPEMRAKQKIKVTFLLLDTQNREIDGCSAILCSENSTIC
jgi:hypothetical protein